MTIWLRLIKDVGAWANGMQSTTQESTYNSSNCYCPSDKKNMDMLYGECMWSRFHMIRDKCNAMGENVRRKHRSLILFEFLTMVFFRSQIHEIHYDINTSHSVFGRLIAKKVSEIHFIIKFAVSSSIKTVHIRWMQSFFSKIFSV